MNDAVVYSLQKIGDSLDQRNCLIHEQNQLLRQLIAIAKCNPNYTKAVHEAAIAAKLRDQTPTHQN